MEVDSFPLLEALSEVQLIIQSWDIQTWAANWSVEEQYEAVGSGDCKDGVEVHGRHLAVNFRQGYKFGRVVEEGQFVVEEAQLLFLALHWQLYWTLEVIQVRSLKTLIGH
jgi:hypothetical protein